MPTDSPAVGSEAATPNNPQSRNPSPSSIPGIQPTESESTSTTVLPSTVASTSQPMAKSLSSSSASVTADAKDAAATGPSPYGTRSRNRTGRSRINYAEDKDLDMTDFDSVAEKKGDTDLKKIRPANANAPPTASDGPPRPSASSTRKPLPSSDGTKSASSAKEQQQQNNAGAAGSTSSAATSAAPSQQASKKRKAGTTSNSSNTKDSSSNSAVAQKPSNVQIEHLGPTGFSETNMMTFENTGAHTSKDNTLTADDGTVLAVNGELGFHFIFVSDFLQASKNFFDFCNISPFLLMHLSRSCLSHL